MNEMEMKPILEALLFIADRPLKAEEMAGALGSTPAQVNAVVDFIEKELEKQDRGVVIERVAGGFRMATKEHVLPYIRKLFQNRVRARLSKSALETLAIIGYRQPITKSEIESIRGVNCESSVSTLMERGLITEVGRKNIIGRPILYGTTEEFLCYFGLNSLRDLPPIEEAPETERVKPLLNTVNMDD